MSRRGRPPHPDVLTPREWEVLALLREGLSDEAIAERLGVSIHGAKYHVREILSKLGVASRQEAAAWQPEGRAPARRWLALPLAARFAGALVVAAAVAGLGVLAWRTLATGVPKEQGLTHPSKPSK
jgi:DNA-binding CsgD family transcriptional regulator